MIYTIYLDAELKNKFTEFQADDSTKIIKIEQLGASKGTIYVTVMASNLVEGFPVEVAYPAEQLPEIKAKNVTITNNIGKDKITFKGLTKGFTYTIYKDVNLKQVVTSFTATKKTKTLILKQIGSKAGALYIVASKDGYESSKAVKVEFQAEPTPALSSKNVKVTNGKKHDKIEFKGLKKRTTYVIYKDAKLKDKLTSFKATKSTKTIKVKQLEKKGGNLYIVAKAPGYEPSAATKVNVPKEK